LVDFVSLQKSAEEWAGIILNYKGKIDRKNMSNQIVKSGYDIQANVQWLTNFYDSILN
jgi:hypothetical protein